MKLTIGDWTEIFRAGDYGKKGSYSDADLDRMVANFNSEDQVPIVLGHPQTDSPAWGWLSEVKRQGNVLLARVGELHKDFAEALAENRFKNRSVRIANTSAGPKLLHLGFLGGVLPEVDGLKKMAQFDGDGDRVDHDFDLAAAAQGDNQEVLDMEKDEQIKKLEADLAAEKAAREADRAAAEARAKKSMLAEFALFVDRELIEKGKLPKTQKDEVVGFMASLPSGEAADFSVEADGATKKYSPVEWFKDFVKMLPTPEFTRELPEGVQKDFALSGGNTKLVDLSHKV